MKHILLTAVCAALSWFAIHAQSNYVPFDDSIPSNWTVSPTSALSLSTEHLKGGSHALKWQAGPDDTLKATTLGIGASGLSSSSHFFIYSPSAGQDTLIVQFLDNNNTVQREGHVLLNFYGWREYHRNLLDDYNYGSSLSAFNLQGFRIIYRPATTGASTRIWLDEMLFTGYGQARTPGPHMALDHQHFALNPEDGPAGNGLESWLNTPDIPDTAATAAELAGLTLVRTTYAHTPITPSPADVTAAKNYVAACNITRNADSTITGRPQNYITIYYPDTLVQLSNYCGILANAWLSNNDSTARSQLLLFTEYLLDQGVAEGGRNVLLTNDYPNTGSFAIGFLQALPVYTGAMRQNIIRMLRWSHEYNKIYQPTVTPGLNVDYLYLKTPCLYELACADSSNNDAVRDLKSLSRWLEQNTLAGQGGRDGIKPDGTGFHHNAHNVTYMHAFNSWIDCAFNVKETPFHISPTAYTNMCGAIKTLFLETSKGTIFANSDCGRTPFQSSIPVDTGEFRKLVTIGGKLSGTNEDQALASAYNYFYNTNYYTDVSAADMDGYYAFNYAQLGVFRKNGWTVPMRGLTDKLFGAEIYPTENRYGRYQSYGAVEVLYNGTLTGSGYKKSGTGWDWNIIPGATTVHLPWSSLNPFPDKAEEHQLKSFAGAMPMGRDGIFGMDFTQDTIAANYTTNNLHFHKSVFAFDTLLVCLGTSINASTGSSRVATNLFQNLADSASSLQIILDSSTHTSTYSASLKIDSPGHWIVNNVKTGYYIPKGNDSLVIVQGQQTTPSQSDSTGDSTNTTNASKAWLTHGASPSNARYHFVIVPNTTTAKMQALAPLLSQNILYSVLSQTDTLHAIRYAPSNTDAYVFFAPQYNVNIGFIKSISQKALLGAKESGDTLTLTIANPDLNTVSDATSYWHSTASSITLTIKGTWTVLQNTSSATITQSGDSLSATFTLQDGFPATLKLLNPSADTSKPGVWTNQYPIDSSWVYGFGRGPKNTDAFFTDSTGKTSISPATGGNNGILATPPSGFVRMSISKGTPRFDLVDSSRKLQMTAAGTSLGNIGRFSAYNIAHATPVASNFFTFTLNDSIATDTVDWTYAIGKNGGGFFNGSSGLASTGKTSATDVFGALKWTISGSNRTVVNFRVREKKDTAANVTYNLASSAFFQRGGSYKMEIYANAGSKIQTYVRGITTYTVPPRTYHVWANNTQLSYQGSASFPGNEMPADSLLYAFLFDSKFSGSVSGGVYTGNNAARMTLAHTIQVNYAPVSTSTGTSAFTRTLTAAPLTLIPATPAASALRLAPNPAHDYIQVIYTAAQPGKTIITVVSMSGQVVIRKEVWLTAGENYITLQIAKLTPGLYTINGQLLLKK